MRKPKTETTDDDPTLHEHLTLVTARTLRDLMLSTGKSKQMTELTKALAHFDHPNVSTNATAAAEFNSDG